MKLEESANLLSSPRILGGRAARLRARWEAPGLPEESRGLSGAAVELQAQLSGLAAEPYLSDGLQLSQHGVLVLLRQRPGQHLVDLLHRSNHEAESLAEITLEPFHNLPHSPFGIQWHPGFHP